MPLQVRCFIFLARKRKTPEKKNSVSLHIPARNLIYVASSMWNHADKRSPLPHKMVIFIMYTVKLLKAKSSKVSNSTSIWNKTMWNTVIVGINLKRKKKKRRKNGIYFDQCHVYKSSFFFCSGNFEPLIFHRISYGYLHFHSVKINYLLAISLICYLWV